MSRLPLGLNWLFYLATASLAAMLTGLFVLFSRFSLQSIQVFADKSLTLQARSARTELREFLQQPPIVIEEFERQIKVGLVHPRDTEEVEAFLFSTLLDHPDLLEASFTFDLAEKGQVSVVRRRSPVGDQLVTLMTREGRQGFERWDRIRPVGGALTSGNLSLWGEVPDPTSHNTYTTPVTRRHAQWTDLSYCQLDAGLPEKERRVTLSVQKRIEDRAGRLFGVLRIGILTDRIDQQMQRVNPEHILFLCDEQGRLIAGPDPTPVYEDDYDLRRRTENPILLRALQTARTVRSNEEWVSDRYTVKGRPYLVSLISVDRASDPLESVHDLAVALTRYTNRVAGRLLDDSIWVNLDNREHINTWDWVLGMVAAEDYYTSAYRDRERKVLGLAAVLLLLILAGGTLVMGWLRRDLGEVAAMATRMQAFEFGPATSRVNFPETSRVMSGLEAAKTVVRSMSRYLPLDLIKQLFARNQEPVLGGHLQPATLMFTDIADFSTIAETMEPNRLASTLGMYFDALAQEILLHEGIIDKYIGDAIMAIWNAPTEVENHALKACRAAYGCVKVTEALFGSQVWGNRPALHTRFGVHTDTVLVGHFGAQNRMDYTSLGDGVNLASRLEGLNK
ncbi:MAG: hypothetical protein KC910_24100, partial [Candidatus Eremiobacteraeota bacterium]|nr:hypothetical protein [Candidatus Eremiobacteraeota bacterium]